MLCDISFLIEKMQFFFSFFEYKCSERHDNIPMLNLDSRNFLQRETTFSNFESALIFLVSIFTDFLPIASRKQKYRSMTRSLLKIAENSWFDKPAFWGKQRWKSMKSLCVIWLSDK